MSALWDPARQTFLTRGSDAIDWDAGVNTSADGALRVILIRVTGGYSFGASDQYLNALGSNFWGNNGSQAYDAGGNTASILIGTASAGVADGQDITLATVSNGSILVSALGIYMQKGSATTTCPLILYIDSVTGMPFTPSGADVVITWDNGANKIFKL